MTVAARDDLIEQIGMVGLDDFDLDDAWSLADVLLEAHTPAEAMSWLCFHDAELDGVPLVLLERGRGREVLRRARGIVLEASR